MIMIVLRLDVLKLNHHLGRSEYSATYTINTAKRSENRIKYCCFNFNKFQNNLNYY